MKRRHTLFTKLCMAWAWAVLGTFIILGIGTIIFGLIYHFHEMAMRLAIVSGIGGGIAAFFYGAFKIAEN